MFIPAVHILQLVIALLLSVSSPKLPNIQREQALSLARQVVREVIHPELYAPGQNGFAPVPASQWAFVEATSGLPGYLERRLSLRLGSSSICNVRAWAQSASLGSFPCLEFGTSTITLQDGDHVTIEGIYQGDGSVLISSMRVVGGLPNQ